MANRFKNEFCRKLDFWPELLWQKARGLGASARVHMATSDAREMEEHLRWVMVQELVVGVTALEPDTENYDTACEWAAGTLQHHTYLDLNIQQVRTTHQETLEKLQAHARFGQADRLAALYDNLVKRDRDYEVRDTSCEKENPRGVVQCVVLLCIGPQCWPAYVGPST